MWYAHYNTLALVDGGVYVSTGGRRGRGGGGGGVATPPPPPPPFGLLRNTQNNRYINLPELTKDRSMYANVEKRRNGERLYENNVFVQR